MAIRFKLETDEEAEEALAQSNLAGWDFLVPLSQALRLADTLAKTHAKMQQQEGEPWSAVDELRHLIASKRTGQ